jgi:hypothetical protein
MFAIVCGLLALIRDPIPLIRHPIALGRRSLTCLDSPLALLQRCRALLLERRLTLELGGAARRLGRLSLNTRIPRLGCFLVTPCSLRLPAG